MLSSIWNWIRGEDIEVEIVSLNYNPEVGNHSLVNCPDNTRKCVNGHLGHVGEVIRVNTWQLWMY